MVVEQTPRPPQLTAAATVTGFPPGRRRSPRWKQKSAKSGSANVSISVRPVLQTVPGKVPPKQPQYRVGRWHWCHGDPEVAVPDGRHILLVAAIGTDGTIYIVQTTAFFTPLTPMVARSGDFRRNICPLGARHCCGRDGLRWIVGQLCIRHQLDGSQKWRFQTGAYVNGSPAIGGDGTVYIGSSDSYLYAINPNGSQKWRFQTGTVNLAPSIGRDGRSTSDHWKIMSMPSTLMAARGGDSRREAASLGRLLSGRTARSTSDHGLLSLRNQPKRQPELGFQTGGRVFSSPAIGADGTICVGSDEQQRLRHKPQRQPESWPSSNRIVGLLVRPHRTGRKVYVGSWDNNIYAINPNGSQKWRFLTGMHGDSSPAIGADGTIYVGAGDFYIYALHRSSSWGRDITSVRDLDCCDSICSGCRMRRRRCEHSGPGKAAPPSP